ncbi:MAG: hypothetical protein WBA07_07910 [Rivularia sp. (in: cyanobacteria)]
MNEVISENQVIRCIATHTGFIDIIEEWKEINTVMRGTGSRFNVETERVRRNGEVVDLIRNKRPNPQIIHISGEGREPNGEIEIPDPEDNEKLELLKPDVLAEFFANVKDVNCVVLNFCFSKRSAELIAKHVQYVIGIDGFIEGTAAVEFSKNFYRSLEGKVLGQNALREAFENGKSAAFDRTRDEGKYVMFTPPQPEMQMEVPLEENTVPYKCECRGTFENFDEGTSMWAYVNALLQGKFYVVPIQNRTPSTNGEWRVNLLIGPEQDNHDYRIGIFYVDPKNTPGFKSEFDEAVKINGFFALDNLPSGTKVFGDRQVTRE